MPKFRQVEKRSVRLFESEEGLVGIEYRFSLLYFVLLMCLIASVLYILKYLENGTLMIYTDFIADRVRNSMIWSYAEAYIPDNFLISEYLLQVAGVLILAPFVAAVSKRKAYAYKGVDDENTLLNIVIGKREPFGEIKKELGRLEKRRDIIVIRAFSDEDSLFRRVEYINGRKIKHLTRKSEALLAEEILLAMEASEELLGERVTAILNMIRDVYRAEEEAHADYLMLALDAIVNYLRERDGATMDELMKDKEIARLDRRYIHKAIRYLREAPGGPYLIESDERLYLSKLLY